MVEIANCEDRGKERGGKRGAAIRVVHQGTYPSKQALHEQEPIAERVLRERLARLPDLLELGGLTGE